MSELGLPATIAVAFDRNDLGVVREAVDEGDRAGRIGKDGVPLLEGQIRRDEDGFLLVATADNLKEEIGGVGVVGQIADFVDGEQVRPGIGAEATFERARRVPAVEIEHEIGRREKAGGVAGQDRLVDEVLREHRLAEPLRTDEDDILALGQEVEREDSLKPRAMELFGPVLVRHRFETTEARGSEPAFDAAPGAILELGLGEGFQEDDGTPALVRRARDEIVEVVGGMRQAQPAKIIGQGRRRDRVD